MTEKRIEVDYLARVEGEGALWVKIADDRVTDVQLNIFEPPLFLTGKDLSALEGRFVKRERIESPGGGAYPARAFWLRLGVPRLNLRTSSFRS